MEISRIKVTPQKANLWMETVNNANRKLFPRRVTEYAADIRSGNWRDTHQNAIAFYSDGELADGQHRLAAIIETGIPVDMFVAYGLSREDGSVIDRGRSRSMVDALRISGLASETNQLSASISTIKLVRLAETGLQDNPTTKGMADLLGMFTPDVQIACGLISGGQTGIRVTSTRAALLTARINLPASTVAHFGRVLVSGMPETPLDATIIRLRNWLLENKQNGSADRLSAYRTTLRAFHAYANGQNLGVIRRTDKFYFRTGVFNAQ